MAQDRQDGILDLLNSRGVALTVAERACWVRGAAEGVEEHMTYEFFFGYINGGGLAGNYRRVCKRANIIYIARKRSNRARQKANWGKKKVKGGSKESER